MPTEPGTQYTIPPGAVAAVLGAKRFDGPTRAKFSAVTVGVTSTRVLDNNPRRVAWMLVNISVSQAFFNFDNLVSSSNGIILGAGGGSISVEVDEDGETPAWEGYGISLGAAGVWWVYEVVRV